MKRLLILVLVVMGMVGCVKRGPVAGVHELTRAEAVEHAGAVTVALVNREGPGEVSVYCSGVWISKDEILTAAHCMTGLAEHLAAEPEGDEEVEVVNPYKMPIHYVVEREVRGLAKEPSAMHLGRLYAMSERLDLAVIKAEATGLVEHAVAEVAAGVPMVGEAVICVGHPRGLYWTYLNGTVSAYRDNWPGSEKDGPYIQVSAPIWFGNSGGGLFDGRGRLIGISSFIYSKAPNVALYVHRDVIAAYLK